jgi:hypothetical protein
MQICTQKCRLVRQCRVSVQRRDRVVRSHDPSLHLEWDIIGIIFLEWDCAYTPARACPGKSLVSTVGTPARGLFFAASQTHGYHSTAVGVSPKTFLRLLQPCCMSYTHRCIATSWVGIYDGKLGKSLCPQRSRSFCAEPLEILGKRAQK